MSGFYKCLNCNAEVSEEQTICPNCGLDLNKIKTKTIAVVLAIFLGVVGAHKFYHGSWVLGILYCIMAINGFSIILGLADALILMVTPEKYYHYRYNKTPPHPFKW